MLLIACGGGEPDAADPVESDPADTTSTTSVAPATTAPPTTTAPPSTTTTIPPPTVPTTDTRIGIVGPEEMVFDWTDDRCEDEHIPDIAARAVRNSDGLVQLYVTH